MKLLRRSYEAFRSHLGNWGLTPRQLFLTSAAIIVGLLFARWAMQASDAPEYARSAVSLISVAIMAVGFVPSSIIFYHTMRSHLAIKSFYCEFGFLPPLTGTERNAKQMLVDAHLAELAEHLDRVYREEEVRGEFLAGIRKEVEKPSGEAFREYEDPEVARHRFVQQLAEEAEYPVAKPVARQRFYGVRDLAASPWLIYRFPVHKSYKEYLLKRVAA